MTTPITAMSDTARPRLFDSHAHLVADDVVRYPRNPRSPPAGHVAPPGVYGRPGGKAGPDPIKEVPDARRMVRWMADQNVEAMVAVQKGLIYRYDNSYILDSSLEYPGIMAAMVILDPLAPETPDTIGRLVESHALCSVRLFGARGEDGLVPWLNSPVALKCWDAVDRTGIVLDIEVIAQGGGGRTLPIVAELARAYSGVRIVLDHMFDPQFEGRDDFGLDENYHLVAALPNVFFKFTTINLDLLREGDTDARQALRVAVDTFGSDRIMWGSDIGTSSGSYAEMVQRILDAAALLSPTERYNVLYATGRKVFSARGSGV